MGAKIPPRGPEKDPFARAVGLTERAMEASDAGDFDQAADMLLEALELMPDEPAFLSNFVEFCLQVAHNATLEDDHTAAIRYYKMVLERTPDDAETWMDLGASYARENKALDALQAWQGALALLNPRKGRDKRNIEAIMENVRAVQDGMKEEAEAE